MASACPSSLSLQKSCASNSCSNVSGTRKQGSDNLCSYNRSCFLQKKKPMNPLAASIRPPARNDVRQRVRSAKMIKIRSLQSQLNDANYHLMELAQENRALKTTQRRQDKALNGYEGVNADLPKLMKAHEEENRVLSEKNRTMKKQLREVTDLLKNRDDELLNVKDQLKHLTALARDKNLDEREQLRDSLNEAKVLIRNYESEISMLNRKLMLEVKNCRQKVNAEVLKHRRCQQELAHALGEIDRQSESKGRLLRKRFDSSPTPNRKSSSNLSSSTSKETLDDVKLEPIKKRNGVDTRVSLTSPVDKIKARLSNEGRPHKIEDFNDILEKLNIEEEYLKKSLLGGLRNGKIKPNKLETLVQSGNGSKKEPKAKSVPPPPPAIVKHKDKVHRQIEHFVDDNELDIDFDDAPKFESASKEKTLPTPPVANIDAIEKTSEDGTISDTDDIVQHHLKSLEESELEFKRVQEEIKEIEMMEAEIGKKKLETLVLKEDDYELVNQIWNEEYSFRKTQRDKNVELESGNTSTNKDPIVVLENKKKLLAALRDIDNGNSIDGENNINVENNVETDGKKSRLLKELFG